MSDIKLSVIQKAFDVMIKNSSIKIVPEDEDVDEDKKTGDKLGDCDNYCEEIRLIEEAKELGLNVDNYTTWGDLEAAVNNKEIEEDPDDDNEDGDNEDEEIDVEEEEIVQAYKCVDAVEHSVKVRTEFGHKIYYGKQELVKSFLDGVNYQKKL